MCDIDATFVPIQVNIHEELLDDSTEPKDIVCDVSIIITLYELAQFKLRKSKKDTSHIILGADRDVDTVDCCDVSDNQRAILIKFSRERHRLVRQLAHAISECTAIKGKDDSFAILKVYKGNCMKTEEQFVYEDFVTPHNTLDIPKFMSFINGIK